MKHPKSRTTCKDIDMGNGISLADHEWVETYNDGKISVLKCEKCGEESVSWTDKATVTKS